MVTREPALVKPLEQETEWKRLSYLSDLGSDSMSLGTPSATGAWSSLLRIQMSTGPSTSCWAAGQTELSIVFVQRCMATARWETNLLRSSGQVSRPWTPRRCMQCRSNKAAEAMCKGGDTLLAAGSDEAGLEGDCCFGSYILSLSERSQVLQSRDGSARLDRAVFKQRHCDQEIWTSAMWRWARWQVLGRSVLDAAYRACRENLWRGNVGPPRKVSTVMTWASFSSARRLPSYSQCWMPTYLNPTAACFIKLWNVAHTLHVRRVSLNGKELVPDLRNFSVPGR
ncbi:hypothetical protein B0T14DRAFT_48977 [Immersiella caudata]|uniref:Uncharacterized protein n=1 Tax=Immersiella caudata TaxID=314043 RepID=A0AA39XFE4_9PEZI|nr:hypothetical protein B0T14DRAFT_48977 [Immersiella caudata]